MSEEVQVFEESSSNVTALEETVAEVAEVSNTTLDVTEVSNATLDVTEVTDATLDVTEVSDATLDVTENTLDGTLEETVSEEHINDLIVKTLKSSLELKDGCSESLTTITGAINESFAECSAATVHECLVRAFPDLQAQQSSDHEEVYYLGIKLNSYLTSEERVVNWLANRFKEDQFGSINVNVVSEIASKEIGFHRSSLVGTYLRKAFPNIYVRRSDRLRWYCGISLPEKVLTDDEKRKVQWMEAASQWLRENVNVNLNAKEKCSLIFAALCQFVGKISIESCLAVVKCVFPTVQRKTYDRQAFYVGIVLGEHIDRNAIHVVERTRPKHDMRVHLPIINEDEKEAVAWLRRTLKESNNNREKLRDISAMLSAKQGEMISEKDCLKFLRKAFPNIGYRRRDTVAFVTGIEIKANFRPKEKWLEKAVAWLRECVSVRGEMHCEKYGPIVDLLKRGLKTVNQNKIFRVFHAAFPEAIVKKSSEGRVVFGLGLIPNYHQIALPEFTEDDFIGDFSDLDVTELPEDDDDDDTRMDFSDSPREDSPKVRKLEEKIDKLTVLVDTMNKEMAGLREELAQSSRQKDSLIVQLQQTLVLLTQQHYSKIFKTEEGEGEETGTGAEEVVDVTIDQNGALI